MCLILKSSNVSGNMVDWLNTEKNFPKYGCTKDKEKKKT